MRLSPAAEGGWLLAERCDILANPPRSLRPLMGIWSSLQVIKSDAIQLHNCLHYKNDSEKATSKESHCRSVIGSDLI